MSAQYLIMLLCGAAAGGFINGLAGFGTALFALGFWLHVLPPAEAVSLAVVMSVLSGLPGAWMVRRSIADKPIRLACFLLPALLGIPLGVALLSVINPVVLKVVIASFLILYGGFFAFRQSLPTIKGSTPVKDGVIGFAGGVLGGAAGLSGALPTMWCAMRPWSKEETRAVTQPYNVLVLFIAALLLAFNGVFDQAGIIRIAIVLPVTLLFAYIGMRVFRRLTDQAFRRLLIVLMLVAGVVLMVRELL